jgi:DNA-binding NarL/FixJ family response regulator
MLEFLSRGFQDKEIAAALGISVWTVHTHMKRTFEKLGVHNRAEAVSRYLQK